MIDTTQLTQLISAFRVETEKESISPETVGSLLQNITDLLAGKRGAGSEQRGAREHRHDPARLQRGKQA